jgi:hypothetical protein
MKNYFRPTILMIAFTAIVLISSCKKDDNEPAEKAVTLYFTFWDESSVNKIDLADDPNSVIELFNSTDGIHSPEGITLTDNGYLIVTEESGNRIIKMKKDGTGDVSVLYDNSDGVNEPTAITIDNATGKIYWCNSGTSQVMIGSDNGLAAPTTMFAGAEVIGYAYGIAIDKKNNKIYTSDFDEGIKVGNLDGTGTPESLWSIDNFDDMDSPSNIFIDVDRGKIYWGDESADQIVEANLSGNGTPKVLFDATDGVDRADGIYVDYNSKKIYWSETNSNIIARGNLDGTGTIEVLVENVESYGIILEFE